MDLSVPSDHAFVFRAIVPVGAQVQRSGATALSIGFVLVDGLQQQRSIDAGVVVHLHDIRGTQLLAILQQSPRLGLEVQVGIGQLDKMQISILLAFRSEG
eukprot:Skav231383  [mRNA]  locus=scaffold1023:66730:77910:- [translate_table: standard]